MQWSQHPVFSGKDYASLCGVHNVERHMRPVELLQANHTKSNLLVLLYQLERKALITSIFSSNLLVRTSVIGWCRVQWCHQSLWVFSMIGLTHYVSSLECKKSC